MPSFHNNLSKGRVYTLYKEGKLKPVNSMDKQILKIALTHFIKVFVYAGISAVIPLILSYLNDNALWIAWTPLINAALYSVKRYIDESSKKVL